METNIITIGNSKGIIIPSKLLKIGGFKSIVNLEINEGKLVISPSKKVREGWEESIKMEIDKNGQPNSLLPDFLDDEQENDWQW
ncbi:MAG TPA: AbrB/MazE/SpoVT family DNA-binding domain-containing protein [Flavobacterium sp.]|nr:AbrB/MazE/SpoVT family DNA-binding domain-containing protein [Flavobacterium sp.]HAT75527.1 AbrB/MazE/SpoVT family DNA-binding domain-containing protein [Flavobacterium sp.]